MVDSQRVRAAYDRARADLLDERTPEGYWIGELSTSALSTATAVSALSLVDRHEHSAMIAGGVDWLLHNGNEDGGWGDTTKSYSNISTTMLVIAALNLAGESENATERIAAAWKYVESKGGVAGLRARYGKDKTFAVPILSNCAMAGLVPWREVSALPFEMACFPQSFYRFLQIPVVSYAIPALVAIGQAKFYHQPTWNPVTRIVRLLTRKPSLRVLQRMQPASGGYLEAVPLTSFVTMSLASIGKADHPVARQGVQFIMDSIRPDGSWPIDTNLATWNTTLAINALARSGDPFEFEAVDWLLSCQHRERHPFTGAEPGGWGWTDLSGAVPDSDDTPGALLALAELTKRGIADETTTTEAASAGVNWLLNLQNRDGGWPTFCRGWGKLPFDRSGADLTAHALRALRMWSVKVPELASRIDAATQRGIAYLQKQQRPDGSWIPLWFGNQDHELEENPVYGTAKVLAASRELGLTETDWSKRGYEWLAMSARSDGAWGCVPPHVSGGSIEETALAVEALMDSPDPSHRVCWECGLEWLCNEVEAGRHRESSPIGFYFAKLWYHERLYPLTFLVGSLGATVRKQSETARNGEANSPPTYPAQSNV